MGNSWGYVTERWQEVTTIQMVEVKELFIVGAISAFFPSLCENSQLLWPIEMGFSFQTTLSHLLCLEN